MKTLWQGKYLSIITPDEMYYECVHEKDVVFVIPIVNDKIVIRKELCPPYIVKDQSGILKYYTVLSGGIEEGESIEYASLRELKEESGIIASKYSMKILEENLPICKSTDMRTTIVFLYISDGLAVTAGFVQVY